MENSLKIPDISTIQSTVSRIRNKEISVLQLVEEHLKRAQDINPKINSFITILESSIDRAKEIDKMISESSKEELDKYSLLGIPFTVKDLYLVEGTKTTFASKFMEDFIAPYTSTVVQKCLNQGAILIAKCNCDPWGFGGSGENSGYGPTKHPLDFSKTPGGSSSGSAASLLAGVGYFSLGTDTGGSIRLPSSFSGLIGIKPTYGRNSRFGIGAMGSSFDTPGFFTRYIKDTVLLEKIMEGKDNNDSTTTDLNLIKTKIIKDPKDITIGIPKEYFEEGLDIEIKEAIDQKINELKEKGFKIKDISIPSTKYGLAIYYILVPSEISSNRGRYDSVRYGKKVSDNYEENMVGSRSKYLEEEVKRRIMIGTYSLSKGYADQFYKQASKVRSKLKGEFDNAFKEVDIILSPVSPTTAFKLGEKSMDPLKMYLVDVYTVTANLVGIPSIALPIAKDRNGMPIGLQLMGRKFEEDNIFKLSEFI